MRTMMSAAIGPEPTFALGAADDRSQPEAAPHAGCSMYRASTLRAESRLTAMRPRARSKIVRATVQADRSEITVG